MKKFSLIISVVILLSSCKKENRDLSVRIDSYEFSWTGINNCNFNGGINNASSFILKLTMHDPLKQLDAGSTWVEHVGSQASNSFTTGKPVNNVITATGLLAYGGSLSTSTSITYRVYIKLKDGMTTNEIQFEAIRQPGAN